MSSVSPKSVPSKPFEALVYSSLGTVWISDTRDPHSAFWYVAAPKVDDEKVEAAEALASLCEMNMNK